MTSNKVHDDSTIGVSKLHDMLNSYNRSMVIEQETRLISSDLISRPNSSHRSQTSKRRKKPKTKNKSIDKIKIKLKRKDYFAMTMKKSFISTLFGWIFGLTGNIDITSKYTRDAIEALGLTKWQLLRLRKIFDDIDITSEESITISEFFEYFEIIETPFNIRIFEMIQLERNDDIDFNDFIRIILKLCIFTKEQLLRFAFDCFDESDSGTIDEEELEELCK